MSNDAFTDDDLKRLKETLSQSEQGTASNAKWNLDKWKALITRLEAAEHYIGACQAGNPNMMEDSFIAWRVRCGK